MDGQSTAAAHDMAPYRKGGSTMRRDGAELSLVRGASTMHTPMLPASFEHWAARRGMTRYRIHVGDLIVELRYFARQTGIDHRVAANRALLILPLTNAAEIVSETANLCCPAGVPFLFARDEAATTVWRTASWGLTIQLHRNRINHAASTAFGDARRLMSVAGTLAPTGSTPIGSTSHIEKLAEHLVTLIAGSGPQNVPAMLALESSFYRALANRIAEQEQTNALLSPVRSVSEAMRVVRDNHSRAYDTEALAAIVGVTASTLRKGFRSCLGLSVKEYIQMVRLDWAHLTLSSGCESRPIAEIATLAGFPKSPPFSRAYMRRFGEPPSQTRARAVRDATG